MPLAILLIASIAAVTDARSGRIPNQLTLPALLAGIVWQSVADGALGATQALAGALVCGLIPWLLHRATKGNAIGGGDVKLFAALGAWAGPLQGLEIELSSFLVLAIFALLQLAYQGTLLKVLVNTLSLLLNPILPRKWKRELRQETLTEMRLGPAIAVAAMVVVVRQLWLPQLPWPV